MKIKPRTLNPLDYFILRAIRRELVRTIFRVADMEPTYVRKPKRK